jgi:hypothetical protein
VLHLPHDATRDLALRYRFSTPNDIGKTTPYDKLTLYCLVGYPHSKNRPLPKSFVAIKARPYFFVLREFAELDHLSASGKRSSVHIGFSAPKKHFTDFNFRPINPPKPQGMSGGGIWRMQVNQNGGGISSPELVGIEIEYHKETKVFIATRIDYAVALVADFNKHP